MHTQRFPWEEGGPKRLELSWRGQRYEELQASVDGGLVGRSLGREALLVTCSDAKPRGRGLRTRCRRTWSRGRLSADGAFKSDAQARPGADSIRRPPGRALILDGA
jgi:hypothetical protein